MLTLVAKIGKQFWELFKLNKIFKTTSDYYCLMFLNL